MTETTTTTTTADPVALARLIVAADEAYYAGDDTGLTDAAYDQAKRDLDAAATADPRLLDDPTVARALTEVGRTTPSPADGATFAPERHGEPMLSLSNALSAADLQGFVDRAVAAAGPGITFTVEPKHDGASLNVRYAAGALDVAITRGDGTVGEDVTATARLVAGIPTRIATPPESVEVRGEVVILRADWDAVQADRTATGAEPFANRRNAAAGGLRNTDPDQARARRLTFRAYGVAAWDGHGEPDGHAAAIDWLRAQGFDVVDVTTGLPPADVVPAAEALAARRDDAPEDRDGVVVKVEQADARTAIGGTSKHPNWAIALKPAAERATTKLVGVEFATGRTGRVAPRAVLDPVAVGGVTVTYVTLNNEAHARAKGVKVGDTVVVQRAGEVIPEIVGPVVADRDGTETDIDWPTRCPSCDSLLDREESADARCVDPACPAQLRARLAYVASRDILDIDGVGGVLIDKALDAGLIEQVGDLLHLTAADLRPLDRVGDALAAKVEANIRAAVARANDEPRRVLASLGIRTIGRSQSRDLVAALGSVNAVRAATAEQVEAVDGFGPERARRLADGLADPRTVAVLDRYADAGIDLDATPEGFGQAPAVGTATLDGVRVVITGTLDRDRSAIKADLEALGAKVSGSVSGSTDLLVAGDKAGSKRTKAEAAGVPVVGQDGLDRLLAGASLAEALT